MATPPRSDEQGGGGDRKLKVRGLKSFVEKHNGGIPPNWVKEFPCRSRYHVDSYLYTPEEGSFDARNSEACRGGRCNKCGIYATALCPTCHLCEPDCSCPKSNPPAQDPFLNPLAGLPQTLNTAHRILETSENAPRQYPFRNPDPKNQTHQGMPLYVPQPPYMMSPYGYPMPHPYAYPPPFGYPYMMPQGPQPPFYGYPYPPPNIIPYGSPPLIVPPCPYPPQPPIGRTESRSSQQPTYRSHVSIN